MEHARILNAVSKALKTLHSCREHLGPSPITQPRPCFVSNACRILRLPLAGILYGRGVGNGNHSGGFENGEAFQRWEANPVRYTYLSLIRRLTSQVRGVPPRPSSL